MAAGGECSVVGEQAAAGGSDEKPDGGGMVLGVAGDESCAGCVEPVQKVGEPGARGGVVRGSEGGCVDEKGDGTRDFRESDAIYQAVRKSRG